MNGLATLLAPVGDLPEVLGMAGRPPGTAEQATDADGFSGILQQMMAGTAQVASLMSMLPALHMLPVQGSDGEGGDTVLHANPGGQPAITVGDGSVVTEQQSTPTLLSLSPHGTSLPAALEVDLPPPNVPATTLTVVEHLASSDPGDQTIRLQSDVIANEGPSFGSGGFTLPITGDLPINDADLQFSLEKLRIPSRSAAGSDVPLSADDGDQAMVKGKAGSPVSMADQRVPRKTPATTTQAFEPLLQGTRQSRGVMSAVEHNRERATVDAPTGNEQARENRTVRVPVVLADSNVSTGQKAEGKTREVAHAEPVAASPDAAEEETPVPAKAGGTSAVSEEMPAKAVTTTKPVFESASREGETARNPFAHLQTPISAIRSAVPRTDAGISRFTEVLMPLPPETARSVIDQVVTEAALRVRGATSEMRITLVPASLGEVKLNVRMEGGQMQAQIDVSHAAVKAALEVNMVQLRDALSSQGIEIQRLDVYHSGQSLTGDTRGNQGDRPRRQGGRHHAFAPEAVDQYATGRLLGYNTMEVVM